MPIETSKEPVDRLKLQITIEIVKPIDVERDRLNDDGRLKVDSIYDILPFLKDQYLLTEIKICLENKHATFTNNSETSNTSSLI